MPWMLPGTGTLCGELAPGVMGRAFESPMSGHMHTPAMTTRAPRPRATRQVVIGCARAADVARRMGRGLREGRVAGGLTQEEAGDRAGVSQAEIARLEAGRGTGTSLGTWASCAAAVGLQLAAFLEQAPGADLPRDIEHLRRQNLVCAFSAPGGWEAEPESLLQGDGPRPRSIDVFLTRQVRLEAAVVEIWDLLLDGGDAIRGLEAKVAATRERLGPTWHVDGLLVVRGTRRNRALVGQLGALFAARYPASSVAWLRALGDPAEPLPRGGGFAWTDVRGERLIPSRLPRRGT
jgi:transcriptional regulator with XRE-family HTH domain